MPDLRTNAERLSDWLLPETETTFNVAIFNCIGSRGSDLEDAKIAEWVLEVPISQMICLLTGSDIYDVLVALKLCPSKAQAKSVWKKSTREVEEGLTTWSFGKKKVKFHIWKTLGFPIDWTG